MEQKKFIDIEKILREKAFKLYKWLPRFAINWLKRKLHEQEINDAMWKLRDAKGLDFNTKALDELGAKVLSVNPQNVPVTGNVTIASNHPLGGLDGMALIKAVGKSDLMCIFLSTTSLKILLITEMYSSPLIN